MFYGFVENAVNDESVFVLMVTEAASCAIFIRAKPYMSARVERLRVRFSARPTPLWNRSDAHEFFTRKRKELKLLRQLPLSKVGRPVLA